MNINKLQADLQHVPDQALIGYVQNPNGEVPSYLALAELSRRKKIRAAGPEQQPQAAKPSVAQQLVQEAQPQPGLAQLPVPEHMFNEKTMAAGGIVAFDGGGNVGYPMDAPGLSEADLAYAEAMRNNWVTPALGEAAKWTAAWPFMAAKRGYEKLTEDQPVWDSKQNKLVSKKDIRAAEAAGNKAASDAAFKAEGEAGLKKRQDYLNANPRIANPALRSNPAYTPSAADQIANSQIINSALGNNPLAPAAAPAPNAPPPAAGGKGGVKLPGAAPLPAGLANLAAPKVEFNDADYDSAMLPKRTAEEEMARYQQMAGKNEGLSALQTRLADMETKAKGEEEKAPWMALARAGLGMAAGKSPFALQNIAEGATAGLADLSAAKDKMAAAEEKRFTLQSQLAQADRAEKLAALKFGTDSEQYADAQNRTTQLHKMDAKATAKLHDAANQLTAQGNAIKAYEAQNQAAYQQGSLANQKAQVGKLSDYETYLEGAKKNPANYTTIQTKQGPQQIFDIDKVTANYRGAGSSGKITEREMRDAFQDYNAGKYFGAKPGMNYNQFINWYNSGNAGGATDYSKWGDPTLANK
jgi:hypothetical protein